MSNQIARRKEENYGRDKYARYLLKTDVPIASGVNVSIPFDDLIETSLIGIITHNLGSSTYTVQRAGLFTINTSAGFSSNVAASGYRRVFIATSISSQQIAENISPTMPDPEDTMVSCTITMRFEVGDTFDISCKHNEVAGLNLVGYDTQPNKCCSLNITYFG